MLPSIPALRRRRGFAFPRVAGISTLIELHSVRIAKDNPFYKTWATAQVVARYMPADPRAFLDAAHAADLHVSYDGVGLHFAEGDILEDTIVFYKSWLHATPGAAEAVKKLLTARGMKQRLFPL